MIMRKQTRKLFSKTKKSGGREVYYKTLTQYYTEVRRAQRDSWRLMRS